MNCAIELKRMQEASMLFHGITESHNNPSERNLLLFKVTFYPTLSTPHPRLKAKLF